MSRAASSVTCHADSLQATGAQRGALGIVVPVYNEAPLLPAALEHLQRIAPGVPVIVADGGSTDGSAEIAERYFPVIRCGAPNRGAQMNTAARALATETLLFLHVDSRLPEDFAAHIARALDDPRTAAGCFRLRFETNTPWLRFYSWCTRFRGRFLHFGDQAFFVRRSVFKQMGGYRELPFMEDVDFLRRLIVPGFLGLGRRAGKFVVVPAGVTTSARRFVRQGIVRQQLTNVLLVTLFELGVPARHLARLYPHIR
ncbi:MAG TPA: TIGR04283 family arsenosugar biosynthesis glycosyltransferase [Candidatus Acidoferrales bacterium]